MEEREYSWEKLEEGLQYFVAGLGTKVLLADRLAILWKDIHMIGYESISTPLTGLERRLIPWSCILTFGGIPLWHRAFA